MTRWPSSRLQLFGTPSSRDARTSNCRNDHPFLLTAGILSDVSNQLPLPRDLAEAQGEELKEANRELG